jgi:ribonuclease J
MTSEPVTESAQTDAAYSLAGRALQVVVKSTGVQQLPPGALRVIPLGGVDEIGRNMTILEHAGRLLIIDCGVLFPEEHQPGVDLVLPDFTILANRWDDIEAVLLTHGSP